MGTKETPIQNKILKFLENKSNTYTVRVGSGAIKTQWGGYFKTGKRGCPDIICCYRGFFVGIEVKAEKGKQSQEQKDTEKQIKQIGGYYFVARSVDDVKINIDLIDKQIDFYKEWMK
jgi:Holliday junction resolvase